jgi:hypothetical protein
MMWWLVTGVMGLVILGWISLWGIEMSGSGSHSTSLFSRVKNALTSIGAPAKKTSAAEKEIRQLDAQVFPKFQ